jgi:hypothetical protein
MAKFNPFEKEKYSREQVETIFGAKANGAVAQRLRTENAEMYADVKREAIRIGLLGPGSVVETPAPYVKPGPVELSISFTDAEILARPDHDEKSLRELFAGKATTGKNIGKIATDAPSLYASLRRAAQLRGILPRDPGEAAATQQEPRQAGFRLSDNLARLAHLPLGVHVTAEQFAKISENLTHATNAAKREAAAKSETEVVS